MKTSYTWTCGAHFLSWHSKLPAIWYPKIQNSNATRKFPNKIYHFMKLLQEPSRNTIRFIRHAVILPATNMSILHSSPSPR